MDYQLPKDEYEYHVRLWAAEQRFEELGHALEEKCNLDPMLFDRFRDALQETRRDPEDEDAELRYILAFTDFLKAVLE